MVIVVVVRAAVALVIISSEIVDVVEQGSADAEILVCRGDVDAVEFGGLIWGQVREAGFGGVEFYLGEAEDWEWGWV